MRRDRSRCDRRFRTRPAAEPRRGCAGRTLARRAARPRRARASGGRDGARSLHQLLVILLDALLVLLRRLLLHRVEQLLAELLRPAARLRVGDLHLARIHVSRVVLALIAARLSPRHRHAWPALSLAPGLLGELLHRVLELLQLLDRLLLTGLRAARLTLTQPLFRAPHALLGLLEHLLVLRPEDGDLAADFAKLVARLLQLVSVLALLRLLLEHLLHLLRAERLAARDRLFQLAHHLAPRRRGAL